MEKIIIRELIQIGSEHKQCEDSVLQITRTQGDYDYYFLVTMDGCSTGQDSHFASTLMKKVLREAIDRVYMEGVIVDLKFILSQIIYQMVDKLREVRSILNLRIEELLSTIVLGIVRKYRLEKPFLFKNSYQDEVLVCVSGDGCFMLNEELEIVDQNNQPDYLAYHLNEGYRSITDTFKIFHVQKEIHNFAVMSDGILSFKKEQSEELEVPRQKLLRDQNLVKSEAMLPRVCNLLTRDGYYHYDDLSIVRLISISE